MCGHIKGLLTKFLNGDNLKKLYTDPKRTTEKEHGSARKIFVFFYFINYVLRWGSYLNNENVEIKGEPPTNFFAHFYSALDDLLKRCGYGNLYYADPFDWLILSCVCSLNENDQSGEGDDLDALSLYYEILECLLKEL